MSFEKGSVNELPHDAVEQTLAAFKQGFNCAQSVLSVFGPRFGLDRETGLRVAGAFGAGMSRTGETCGAVTGALMVIGLKRAKMMPDDDEGRETAYELSQCFMEEFGGRNKSLLCRELLGNDVSTPEGMSVVREQQLFTTVCPRFVRDAAELLGEILTERDGA